MVILEAKLAGEVVLVACKGLPVRLVRVARRKVEVLAPAILVKVSGHVVVLVHHLLAVLLAVILSASALCVQLSVAAHARLGVLHVAVINKQALARVRGGGQGI